jgi:hypothetical protein
MRFEVGLTITRCPATKVARLASGLMKMGTSSGTTWPGMTIPEEPSVRARFRRSLIPLVNPKESQIASTMC